MKRDIGVIKSDYRRKVLVSQVIALALGLNLKTPGRNFYLFLQNELIKIPTKTSIEDTICWEEIGFGKTM
jgi:hypothetical protein